ncbi:aftiphilin [Gastrophryne carolinensis]
MEPEIIRMYSSSPPPLDSVADDDDEDDFGEFGGFSEVNNSGIGFADFDASNYSKSREDFIPSKHLLPINDYTENSVNNFASLTSIKTSENVAEISSSKKGRSSVFDLNTNHETTQFNVAALDNKGSSGENEKHLHSETCPSSLDNVGLEPRIQDRIINTCNGEKIHNLEGLTNGFAIGESANPQGLQDMDSMKGFKSVSSHSTDLSIDFSPPSPEEDFADFATFSSKEPVDLDDTDPQAHKDLYKEQIPGLHDNTKLRRSEDEIISAPTEVLNDPVPQDAVELNDLVSVNLPLGQDLTAAGSIPSSIPIAPTPETNTSNIMHSPDTTRTPGLSQNENAEVLDDDSSLTHEKSLDANHLTLDLNKESGCTNTGNISHASEDYGSPFEDFDAATKESPPPLKDSSDSSETPFHAPLGLDMNELDDDFGDFKDMNHDSFPEGLAEASEKQSLEDVAEHHSQPLPSEEAEFSDFGHFVTLEKKDKAGGVSGSDDFAEFSSVGAAQPPEWNAFEDDQEESSSWAAFGDQKTDSQAESDDWQSFRTDHPPSTDIQVTNTQSDDLPAFHESKANVVCEDSTFAFQHSLLGRLERVIQASFPPPSVANLEENISPLDLLCTEQQEESSKAKPSSRLHSEVLDIWMELQDIHDAHGLKYQWGGSHSNKKLLRCLGIDTRNILFTGNKKQPVIVPMYAAGLGMLEPTKEPLKPLSAAEKIASIGQSSHTPPDDVSSSDPLQESLPPVQFDWSSSGLTNPLDVEEQGIGGSTLLNLDFFGPVDDSGFNSSTTLPGVDPELYALTTSKVECSSASNKVTDAFAKLMSTAETTSTSARKLHRDENLSEEAAKVIASLPDLSFMHAKVLMFPVSLTPLSSSEDHVD